MTKRLGLVAPEITWRSPWVIDSTELKCSLLRDLGNFNAVKMSHK